MVRLKSLNRVDNMQQNCLHVLKCSMYTVWYSRWQYAPFLSCCDTPINTVSWAYQQHVCSSPPSTNNLSRPRQWRLFGCWYRLKKIYIMHTYSKCQTITFKFTLSRLRRSITLVSVKYIWTYNKQLASWPNPKITSVYQHL